MAKVFRVAVNGDELRTLESFVDDALATARRAGKGKLKVSRAALTRHILEQVISAAIKQLDTTDAELVVGGKSLGRITPLPAP